MSRRRILPVTSLILLGTLVFPLLPVSAQGPTPAGPASPAQAIDPRDRDFWNKEYNGPRSAFNHLPSQLLVDAVRDRKPGAALDLGMGEGRNAIYLAQQGWRVMGVDLSDVAIGQAKKHADQAGVKVDMVVDGLDHYDFGRNRWDLIILFYMHRWYNGAKPRSTQRIQEALKEGGLLVMEGYAGSEQFTFQPNELLRDFADLRILRYEDIKGEADWDPGKKDQIVRFVAVKENSGPRAAKPFAQPLTPVLLTLAARSAEKDPR